MKRKALQTAAGSKHPCPDLLHSTAEHPRLSADAAHRSSSSPSGTSYSLQTTLQQHGFKTVKFSRTLASKPMTAAAAAKPAAHPALSLAATEASTDLEASCMTAAGSNRRLQLPCWWQQQRPVPTAAAPAFGTSPAMADSGMSPASGLQRSAGFALPASRACLSLDLYNSDAGNASLEDLGSPSICQAPRPSKKSCISYSSKPSAPLSLPRLSLPDDQDASCYLTSLASPSVHQAAPTAAALESPSVYQPAPRAAAACPASPGSRGWAEPSIADAGGTSLLSYDDAQCLDDDALSNKCPLPPAPPVSPAAGFAGALPGFAGFPAGTWMASGKQQLGSPLQVQRGRCSFAASPSVVQSWGAGLELSDEEEEVQDDAAMTAPTAAQQAPAAHHQQPSPASGWEVDHQEQPSVLEDLPAQVPCSPQANPQHRDLDWVSGSQQLNHSSAAAAHAAGATGSMLTCQPAVRQVSTWPLAHFAVPLQVLQYACQAHRFAHQCVPQQPDGLS